MKHVIFFSLFLFVVQLPAQVYFSKTALVKFNSATKLENISATNSTSNAVLDTKTGKIEFSSLNKAFVFEKALMQEHFNENYMESDKYPKTSFKGSVQNWSDAYTKIGTHKVNVSGNLTMHGVTQTITLPVELIVDDKGTIVGKTNFKVKCSDYQIAIPSLVKDNIAKEIDVVVKVELKKLVK